MIAIGGLLVIVIVVAVVAVVVTSAGGARRPPRLEDQLGRWVSDGLVSAEQATAILAHEAARTTPGPVTSIAPATAAVSEPPPASTEQPTAHTGPAGGTAPLIEGLGYLGGVLSLTGVVLLVARFWQDLGTGAQLALTGVTSAALIGAGMAVPEARSASTRRVRAFLWTLATVSTGVFAAVAADAADAVDQLVVAWTAGAVAATSAAMWQGRDRPVQQAIALGAALVAVGAAVFEPLGQVPAGLAVWVLGAAILALGVRAVTTAPTLSVVAGSVGIAVGSIMSAGNDPGIQMAFAVATGLALIGLAIHPRLVTRTGSIVALSAVGGITTLQTLPALVGTMAQRAGVATGAVLWAAALGVLLVGSRRVTRAPRFVESAGAATMLVACAVTAAQEPAVATIAGLLTSLALLGASMTPGRIALSIVGALGLLAFVPWTIAWFFPGEGRVPLLISVSGVLIIAIAVLMARSGDRFRAELGHRNHPQPS